MSAKGKLGILVLVVIVGTSILGGLGCGRPKVSGDCATAMPTGIDTARKPGNEECVAYVVAKRPAIRVGAACGEVLADKPECCTPYPISSAYCYIDFYTRRPLPDSGLLAWTPAKVAGDISAANNDLRAVFRPGDVLVWPKNVDGAKEDGHVAFVEQVCADKVKISQANWWENGKQVTNDELAADDLRLLAVLPGPR